MIYALVLVVCGQFGDDPSVTKPSLPKRTGSYYSAKLTGREKGSHSEIAADKVEPKKDALAPKVSTKFLMRQQQMAATIKMYDLIFPPSWGTTQPYRPNNAYRNTGPVYHIPHSTFITPNKTGRLSGMR